MTQFFRLPLPGQKLASYCLPFALAISAFAQQAGVKPKPELPSGPLLAAAPEFSKWSIAFSYLEDRAAQEKGAPRTSSQMNAPRQIVTTKTRDIIHEESVNVAGVKLDKWQVGDTFYKIAPGQKSWGAYDPEYLKNNFPLDQAYVDAQKSDLTADVASLPIPKNGFRGLDWIGPETYAGAINLSGGTYLVFVPSGASSLDLRNAATLGAQPVIAYVDGRTRLPYLVRKNNVTCTYTFYPPPAALLTPPPDLAAEIQKGKATRARFNAAPQKEY